VISPVRRAPVLAAALAAVLALSACTGDAGDGGEPVTPQLKPVNPNGDGLLPVGEREPAPALAGPTLGGEQVDVADLNGDVVVVNFWASWCAPCRAEADNLIAVAEQTADDGVSFVGVNVRDEQGNAEAFERQYAVPYPSIHDQPGALLTRFRRLVPQTPPTTLLLDRQGRIAASFIGGVTEAELLEPVQQLAAEPA
jgi:thiol-disulfide isomerase/thioredoxin